MAFRFSAVDVRCPWRGGNYLPDGAVDRQAVGLMYQGISAAVAAAPVAQANPSGGGRMTRGAIFAPDSPVAKKKKVIALKAKKEEHAEHIVANLGETALFRIDSNVVPFPEKLPELPALLKFPELLKELPKPELVTRDDAKTLIAEAVEAVRRELQTEKDQAKLLDYLEAESEQQLKGLESEVLLLLLLVE